MKKIMFFILLPLVLAGNSFAQNVHPFEATEVYWYGLDFSKSKMVGNFSQFSDAGAKNGFDIRNIYFKAWNKTIVSEPEKYTLEKFFHASKVDLTISVTEAVNQETDGAKLMILDTYSKELSLDDIQNCVYQYTLEQKSGVGIVFIIEKFDKYEEKGVMNVVYFDIATKNVLFSKRMYGEAGGIGIKNYWIRTVYNVMEEVSRQQPNWRKNN